MRLPTQLLIPLALTVASLSGSVTAGAVASSPAPSLPLADFERFVSQAVADWEVPGLVISVVKDGEVVFAGSYGVRSLTAPVPVDGRSLFAIGSTTKAFTAAAVGLLVDDGKLGWDDPVSRYLPEFRVADPWVNAELRVRDLLTHRAGMPNTDLLWYGQSRSTTDILSAMAEVEPATSMRSHFTYQNVMYAAAGELVATVSGMPWGEFVTQRLLEPLAMSDTVTSLSATLDLDNVATPHDRIDGEIVPIENVSVDPVAAAGSIWSSRDDMTRWIRFLLAGGVGPDGSRLMSEDLVREMFTPQALIGPDQFYPTAEFTRPHWTSYGLGWFQQDYRGMAVDFHTGSIDGMVAIAGLIRDLDLGVYVLANLDHAELRHALMLTVFDAYIGETEKNWSTELREFYALQREKADVAEAEAELTRAEGTQPSLALAAYAGRYEHPAWGALDVLADGGLRVEFGNRFSGSMTHWHYDTFRIDFDKAWVGSGLFTFHLGSDGKIAYIEALGQRFDRAPAE